MWTDRLPAVAPSAGALESARILIDILTAVADDIAQGWTTSPPENAASVAVQAAVLENEALEFAHGIVPLADGVSAVTMQFVCDAGICPGPDGRSVVDHLSSVFREAESLSEQLDRALETWGDRLAPELIERVLRAHDVVQEETTFRGGGPGPVEVPRFDGHGDDSEAGERNVTNGGGGPVDVAQFTEDKDWMPSLVLIAKQTYVWLDQLSTEHGRPIRTLDAIPDEALAELARRGMSGLWLIGLWQRSEGSAEIKRCMGNPEALASAYSLYDYVIAEDLGGEAALEVLRERAADHGIRLAADMVPNHVGVDGRWVVERPELFVQLDRPPFDYHFTGPDLCTSPDVEIRLDDGYWDRSDAAVVFERRNAETGEARYLYHGNDGTSMPWNDTAQLDYLNPEVRELVIQTVLDVARRFPVIRFDAAMTLARKHVRRLWHPPPGEGGAIPSRSRYAASSQAFDAAMPREFWRQVVERVQEECPDTLLLAEAFWMMEGYFVRTLGIHRVYNSAFMHMLRDEDNAGFRRLLREVLEHDPAVLERFVNFMNNPDEDSAVAQFGRGDKYFGVATLLSTLPGLPMFGHGQFEGFAEKYGMEYAKAYADESVDEGLLAHHERVIVPLLTRRSLFCGVEWFAMYDFVQEDGTVDENVIAYSNMSADGERSTVLFNNSAEATEGRLLRPFPEGGGDDGEIGRWYDLPGYAYRVWLDGVPVA